MRALVRFRTKAAFVFTSFLLGALCSSASASSYLGTGQYFAHSSLGGTDEHLSQCLFFTGPHGDFLEENEFLMILMDSELGDGVEIVAHGTYERSSTGRYILKPDKEDLLESMRLLVAEELPDDRFSIVLTNVAAAVSEDPDGEEIIKCKFKARAQFTGRGSGGRLAVRGPVTGSGSPESGRRNYLNVSVRGEGRHFTDVEVADGAAAATSDANLGEVQEACPIPDLGAATQFCTTSDAECLLDFAGKRWWTNYHYVGPPNYYYEGNQAWNPGGAYVDSEGLHLTVKQVDLGGGTVWTASEVVLMFEGGGETPVMLGYGTYLISAKAVSPSTWDALDRNVAFGAFTYQRDKSGDQNNPYRELDLAEISRWGHQPGTDCTGVLDPILCQGNAQFTLQLWNLLPGPANINRYTINPGVSEVTLTMDWPGANQPVTFKQFEGRLTLDQTRNTQPKFSWTTGNGQNGTPNQNPYIPGTGCQRFHMNLWMGNFANDGPHPGPASGANQEVVVTNFQYSPN